MNRPKTKTCPQCELEITYPVPSRLRNCLFGGTHNDLFPKEGTFRLWENVHWGAFALETVGQRAGTYFLLGVGSHGKVQEIRNRYRTEYPNWTVKLKRVLITPLPPKPSSKGRKSTKSRA